MATYKAIKGITIQDLSSDPSTLIQGEVWYNSTSETLKAVISSGAWGAGGAMPTQNVGAASGGTRDAAWVSGGQTPGSTPTPTTATLFYNGTAWSDQSAATSFSAGYIGSTGTQASALMAGGTPLPGTASAQWDGEAWAAITAQPTGRRYVGGFGASGTDAYMVGGATWAGTGLTKTSEVNSWNGTSWTSETGLTTARLLSSGGSGTSTTGIAVGGYIRPPHPGGAATDVVEEFNGTSWGAGTVYPSARDSVMSGGPSTACIAYGGGSSATGAFQYDGESWTALPSMTTGRGAGGRSVGGTTSAQLISGGTPNPGSAPGAQVEEFSVGERAVTMTTA